MDGRKWHVVLLLLLELTGSASYVAAASASQCPDGYIQVSKDYTSLVCQDVEKWLSQSITNPDVLDGNIIIYRNDNQTFNFTVHLESQYNERAEKTAYYNIPKAKVLTSESDILGLHILSTLVKNTDPSYEDIRAGIPPIRDIAGTFEFTDSRFASVDLSFGNQGADVAGMGMPVPQMFMNPSDGYSGYYGHIGYYYPIVVFMFAKPGDVWQFDYVPIPEPIVPGQREQSVFFRALHITAQKASDPPKITLVFNDTYAYYGVYNNYKSYEYGFYDSIIAQKLYWENVWASEKHMTRVKSLGTDPSSPGPTLYYQTLHSIVKDMITRRDFYFPSYGVYPGYGIPGNNGFQEIITVSLPVALEWGLFDYAKGVLKNYLDFYWFRSGNVRYRGLEMAELGRMLTQVAMYYRYTGDSFFIDYMDKINGSVNLLMTRYNNSLKLPSSDPAYGLVTGNDEADLWSVTVAGGHTEYPFYSMSAETIRAFKDLGNVLLNIGNQTQKPDLISLGEGMLSVIPSMMNYLRQSLDKARHNVGGNLYCLPYAAGTGTCENIPKAASGRVSEPWRTYAEMMYSGVLSEQDVEDIVTFSRNSSKSMKLGMLSGTGGECCGSQLMSFTSHGFAWGLLQHDRVVDFLMMFYTAANHAYSRGLWTAPESTDIDRSHTSVAYCSPSEGIVPLMLRWMLLFEDSWSESIWIGKALPRQWLQEGERVQIYNATVSYGSISFTYESQITSQKSITISVEQALAQYPMNGIKLRVRSPSKLPIQKVTLNGQPYTNYNSTEEYINVGTGNVLMTFTVFY